MPDRFIVCFAGMPGAGKSTAAKASERLGFKIVSMGDAVREEAVKRGLPLNDENLGAVMLNLRRRSGMGAVARLTLPKIESCRGRLIAVDSVRSIEEVEVFREVGDVRVLAIHASPQIRYSFLKGRGRGDAPLTWKLFEARDERELSVGVGRVIALADEVVSNNSITVEELQETVLFILRKWVDRHGH